MSKPVIQVSWRKKARNTASRKRQSFASSGKTLLLGRQYNM
jgi:hypothetical protein